MNSFSWKFFMLGLVMKCFSCHPLGDTIMQMNQTEEQQRQVELIKQSILDQLHVKRNVDIEREKRTSHDKSYFDKKLRTNVIVDTLNNSKADSVTAIILADPDADISRKNNLIFQFEFGHKIFTQASLNKATLLFYKTPGPKESKEQKIALAEIILDHVHIFNTVAKESGMEGWVQIDMTKHVSYWVADFDDGQLETRTLKLICTNCKEKLSIKSDGEYTPFVTIDLTANS